MEQLPVIATKRIMTVKGFPKNTKAYFRLSAKWKNH